MRGTNIIDCDYNSNLIYKGLLKCLYDKKFIQICKNAFNPYGGGNAGKKIVEYINKLKFNKTKILIKKHRIKI